MDTRTRLGLRLQIGITLLILTGLAIGLLVFASLGLLQSATTVGESRNARQTADWAARMLTRGEDPEAIAQGMVDAGLADQVEIVVAGRVVLRSPDGASPIQGLPQPDHVDAPSSYRRDTADLGATVIADAPISGDSHVRTIRSVADREVQQRSAELFLILYSLLATFLAVIVGYVLLTRLVVSPIRRLGLAAQRVAEGDHASRVDVKGGNEIGWLGTHFNQMLDRLEEGRQELERKVEALARAKGDLEDAQDAMIRSEKLASVGHLAAGVAHEVGNPLSAVVGMVEFMRDDPDLDRADREDLLARTESELMRMNRIIRDLLDYSRPDDEHSQRASVADAVATTTSLVKAQPSFRSIQLDSDIPPGLTHVRIGQERLVQILLNLLLNAADALDGSGHVRVTARASDGWVEVEVSDDGPGIPHPVKARIFDPFFTTKPPGKGTGLGLAICEKIAESAGGRIEALDREPSGTRFVLWLNSVS